MPPRTRSLYGVFTTLNDIPPLHVDNLLPAKVGAPAVERGSTDAAPTAPTRGDTTGTNTEGGSTVGGGTTVLERTDLGDNGSPYDRGGSGDVPLRPRRVG